jgi:hypothetical protein
MREDVMYFLLSEPDIYTATATFNAIGVCFPVAVVRPYEIQCKLQCNSMQFNAIRCNSMQFNAIQCNSIPYNSKSDRVEHLISGQRAMFDRVEHPILGRRMMFDRVEHAILGQRATFDRVEHRILGQGAMFDRIEHLISGQERCSTRSNIPSRVTDDVRSPKSGVRSSRTSDLGPTSDVRPDRTPDFDPRSVLDRVEHPISGQQAGNSRRSGVCHPSGHRSLTSGSGSAKGNCSRRRLV